MDEARVIVSVTIIVFNIIGNFGNINIIIAVSTTKSLQNKHGYLLRILAFEQIVCLFGELFNCYVGIVAKFIPRTICFRIMSPQIFAVCLQTTMFLALSLDLLLSIFIPVRHRHFPNKQYLAILCLPSVVYALSVIVMGEIYLDDVPIPMCNPPLALAPVASRYWSRSTVILAVVTISFYLIVYMVILCTERCRIKVHIASKKQKKIIRSLTITIILFSCFWCLCMGSVDVANFLTNESVKEIIHSYAAIFAVFTFAQNYYVYFARCDMYRRAFKKQLLCLKTKKISNVLSVLNHNESNVYTSNRW